MQDYAKSSSVPENMRAIFQAAPVEVAKANKPAKKDKAVKEKKAEKAPAKAEKKEKTPKAKK